MKVNEVSMSVPRTSKSMALSFTWRTQHLCYWSSGTFSNGEDPNVCSHRRRPVWSVRCTLNYFVAKLSKAKFKGYYPTEVPVSTILRRYLWVYLRRYLWVPSYGGTCGYHHTEVPVSSSLRRYLWVPSYRGIWEYQPGPAYKGTCEYHPTEVHVLTILRRYLCVPSYGGTCVTNII